MNKHNEKMYQATMAMARSMLKRNLLTVDDYRRIDAIFIEKYHPVFGKLFSNIDLLLLENRGNISMEGGLT